MSTINIESDPLDDQPIQEDNDEDFFDTFDNNDQDQQGNPEQQEQENTNNKDKEWSVDQLRHGNHYHWYPSYKTNNWVYLVTRGKTDLGENNDNDDNNSDENNNNSTKNSNSKKTTSNNKQTCTKLKVWLDINNKLNVVGTLGESALLYDDYDIVIAVDGQGKTSEPLVPRKQYRVRSQENVLTKVALFGHDDDNTDGQRDRGWSISSSSSLSDWSRPRMVSTSSISSLSEVFYSSPRTESMLPEGIELSGEKSNAISMHAQYSWHTLRTGGHPPVARSYHSCSPLSPNSLLIIGGLVERQNGTALCSNRCFRLDLGSKEWEDIQTHGDTPGRRHSHQTVALNSSYDALDCDDSAAMVYLLGGYVESTTKSTWDIYELQLESWEWTRISTKSLMDQNDQSPSTSDWTDILNNHNAVQRIVRPDHGLMGHSMTIIGNGLLMVFGGQLDQHEFSDQLYLFDCKTWFWYQVTTKSGGKGKRTPKGRAYHTCTPLDSTRILLSGGKVSTFMGMTSKNNDELWILDISDWTWLEADSTFDSIGRFPSVSGHTATPVSSALAQGSEVALVCFIGGDRVFGKSHQIVFADADSNQIQKVEKALGSIPPGLVGHTAVRLGALVYVIGGECGKRDGNAAGMSDKVFVLNFGHYFHLMTSGVIQESN